MTWKHLLFVSAPYQHTGVDQYLHELFALGPAVANAPCIRVLWHLEVGSGHPYAAPQCWPLNSQHNGTQVTMFPASAALSSSPPTVLPQPVPVPKRPSLNAAGGLPFPIEFGMAASPRRANFAFSESPSSSSCNSDESFRVEDSDTEYDELIPVCSSNDHSDFEDNRDYTIFKRNSQPLGPSSNTQSTSKRMPIPIVKNSVALHNITRPNPSFLTQEEDLSSSPSSPSRQHPLERHPRSQLSRNSKSKRFAFVPPPLPPMPHSATSFHNDIDSPTTPTAHASLKARHSTRTDPSTRSTLLQTLPLRTLLPAPSHHCGQVSSPQLLESKSSSPQLPSQQQQSQ
ncbi:hypothetical protein B0O80DRAFT_270452 [Mortierella sp. GBAus27b]|nr:hypothetical protein B0O80DRAFT_270452 [Mortierella sp. GBAus27b]